MPSIKIFRESRIICGHVLDVSRAPLLAALRSYDPHLYFKWNPKKRNGLGVWELRRKPEFKTIRETIIPDDDRIPPTQGDIFYYKGMTISQPKYHETLENHVKDFEILGYHILEWVKKHDMWEYGFRGKDMLRTADYKEALFLNKIDEDSASEREYNIRQHKTLIEDFKQYVLSGGNPHRLAEVWNRAK